MAVEKEGGDKSENKPQPEIVKRTHQTHFPVIKIPMRGKGHDNGFEWVPLGNGRSKRVPKKIEVDKGE